MRERARFREARRVQGRSLSRFLGLQRGDAEDVLSGPHLGHVR